MSKSNWRNDIIRRQEDSEPKKRSKTYYHPDGLGGDVQIWIRHTPGANISLRVKKVWTDGITGRNDYDSHLKMNIGSEKEAYRLYKALESFFNDRREAPWFLEE